MSLFTPEFGLAFWMLVVFLLLFGILAKFAWPSIMRSMDERAAYIDKGVEYARDAEAEREKAKADVQALLAEARQQQMEVLQQTAAQVAVEQARREAEVQLRRQVASLSLQIAEKVMRKELSSDKAQAEIVEKLLDELEHKD